MIADALKYLAELSAAAAAPKPLDIKDPRHAHFVIAGEPAAVDVPEAPRAHEAGTLDDLVALANRFKGVVWYDSAAVTLVIDDDAHRVERATLPLITSDVFRKLTELRNSKPKLDQKAFVRLLRIDLAGTLDPVVLQKPASKLKFATDAVTSGTVSRQKESMGREISSRVESDGDIPEDVTLMVPVYKTPGERTPYPVRCSVEVDPGEGTFRLLPYPDELERTTQLAVMSIGERLSVELDEDISAYHGKP
jgi:hypothetical protein